MDKPFILDPCCGSKMFYHDKESDAVMFCDIRELHTKLCDGRELHIQPNKLIDVTNMEDIANEAFNCIIFDPPHLVKVGESSWLAQKYGKLPWKPKAGEQYYSFGGRFFGDPTVWIVVDVIWQGLAYDVAMFDKGWVYRTKEEAESALPRVAAEMGVEYEL